MVFLNTLTHFQKWMVVIKIMLTFYQMFTKMINPTVQLSSDTAVLTYNYEAHRDGMVFKMNCTEVYGLDYASGDGHRLKLSSRPFESIFHRVFQTRMRRFYMRPEINFLLYVLVATAAHIIPMGKVISRPSPNVNSPTIKFTKNITIAPGMVA